jgi:hypothetical protein
MEKQIEPDKLLAELQAEKARRLQAAVEAGEAVVLQPLAVIGIGPPSESQIEAAKTEELERYRHDHPNDGKAVHWDVLHIVTGVERSPDFGSGQDRNVSPARHSSVAEEATPPEPPAPTPPTEKEYVPA